MSIIIEHDKRKREILEKSMDVFLEEGYAGASYQKIADRCGIARTILYTYFRNKQDIFRFTIKQATEGLELAIQAQVSDQRRSASQKLRDILAAVVQRCVLDRKLFMVILEYIMGQRDSQTNPNQMVRRRVIRLRMLIGRVLQEGIKQGEFRPMNLRGINEAIYSLVEAAIVKLTIMRQDNVDEVFEAIDALVSSLKAG